MIRRTVDKIEMTDKNFVKKYDGVFGDVSTLIMCCVTFGSHVLAGRNDTANLRKDRLYKYWN